MKNQKKSNEGSVVTEKKQANIVESRQFPVMSLLPCSEELGAAITKYRQDESDENRAAMMSLVDEGRLKELEELGCSTPADLVMVSVRLGSLLFELYHYNVPMPKAPLAAMIAQKQRQEYASELNQDEFTVPVDVAKVCAQLMNDDERWGNQVFTAFVGIGEGDSATEKPHQLKSMALGFYPQVLNAAIDLVKDHV